MSDYRQRDKVTEIISAVMMALATILSAWSAYQSTRWSGLQMIHFSQATALRTEAERKTNIVTRKIGVDVGLFVEYTAALNRKDQDLADFFFKRFPPRLAAATKAWLSTQPLENVNAPPSPFDMQEYRILELEETETLLDKAERETDLAKEANGIGDNYVLLTVVFASVLFFSGVGVKLALFAIRVAMLSIGGLVLLLSAVALIKFPVY